MKTSPPSPPSPPPDVDPRFVEFVAARSSALFRTAVMIIGDRHLAEDLVQTALERAFRHWDRIVTKDAPEAYVRKILANLATDHLRRRHREVVAGVEDDGAGPDVYGDLDERELIMKALRRLPPRMRTVLVLRYFDDMSEAQIADTLGVSAGTVKSTAARGLAKLRNAIAHLEEGRAA